MKKVLVGWGVGLIVFAWIGTASAALIGLDDWETISPTENGALVDITEDGDFSVRLGTDASMHNQAIGTFGAGIQAPADGKFKMSFVVSTWDSSRYDNFAIKVSDFGFDWDFLRDPTEETILSFGGVSWQDNKLEICTIPEFSVVLKSGQFLSFVLETRHDPFFSSQMKGKISFEGNPVAAPVPEPASMLLFGTGLAGLAGVSFKRRKK